MSYETLESVCIVTVDNHMIQKIEKDKKDNDIILLVLVAIFSLTMNNIYISVEYV
jgi:hypothetical protein